MDKSLGHKTSIFEIPVANEELYKEVARRCSTSPKQVEECVNILGKFINKTIKDGAFESIMIPYFGKFKVKASRAQWKTHSKVLPHLPTHLKPKKVEK